MIPSDARGCAERDPRLHVGHAELLRTPCRRHNPYHVVDQRVMNEVVRGHLLQALEVAGVRDHLRLRRGDAHPVDDLALLLRRRIVDVILNRKRSRWASGSG